MKPSASFAPRAVSLALAAVVGLVASSAHATPPRATASAAPLPRHLARGAAAVPPAPEPPPVALQLGGLRIFVPIPRAALVHAIARDAWPQLVRCAGPAPRTRGYASVQLIESSDGVSVHVEGGPVAHDAALARCVRSALTAVALPPYEGDPPAVSVSFDLAFAMPPLGTVAPRRRTRR